MRVHNRQTEESKGAHPRHILKFSCTQTNILRLFAGLSLVLIFVGSLSHSLSLSLSSSWYLHFSAGLSLHLFFGFSSHPQIEHERCLTQKKRHTLMLIKTHTPLLDRFSKIDWQQRCLSLLSQNNRMDTSHAHACEPTQAHKCTLRSSV